MCGRAVNRTGLQASPIACFRTAGGNPAVEKHLIQGRGGGVAILLGMLHAKETWMSSGLCAPLPYFYLNPKYCQLNTPLILSHQSLISLDY